MADRPIRIVIDERCFRELVNGCIAKQRIQPGLNGRMAEIILEDIGFRRMYDIIFEAAVAAGLRLAAEWGGEEGVKE